MGSKFGTVKMNFGFPGGMSSHRFFIDCREKGIQLTERQAAELRESWLTAFPEMKLHFDITPETNLSSVDSTFGYVRRPEYSVDAYEEDEEDIPDDRQGDRYGYKATLVNGMMRARCSYNSALNIQFQGLAAYGNKCGLWNMAMRGYLPRMLNTVHDEVIYWLMPDELDVHIPIIEQCMVDGMRIATPHVKVGVETCCMWHWDKHAQPYIKLQRAENGDYIIEEPPYVQSLQ